MSAQGNRWAALVGATIEAVDDDGRQTRIQLLGADGPHTVVVSRARGRWSSLRSTPSGAIERVTPVFTDDQAMVRLETDAGEELMVTGRGAWVT